MVGISTSVLFMAEIYIYIHIYTYIYIHIFLKVTGHFYFSAVILGTWDLSFPKRD